MSRGHGRLPEPGNLIAVVQSKRGRNDDVIPHRLCSSKRTLLPQRFEGGARGAQKVSVNARWSRPLPSVGVGHTCERDGYAHRREDVSEGDDL